MKRLRIPMGAVFAGLLFSSSVLATTHYVDVNGTNPVPPYASWTTAATNIQDAVDPATNGDLVLVTNGVYATGGRRWYDSGTNRVTLTNAVTLRSVNGPAVTLIVGNQIVGTGQVLTNTVRCVGMGNNAVLSGFTLTNGEAGWGNYPNGGGVANLVSGISTITNCVVVGNLSTNGAGGGAYRVKLIDCQLMRNHASEDGGACACTLVSCVVVSNTAASGGGAYGSSTYGASLLTNCTVSGNTASGSGGGVYSSALDHCILQHNFAIDGGGGAYGGTLINCVLNNNISGNLSTGGNSAGSGGGANSAVLYNCTLKGNSAGRGGGAAFGTANNCILYYNDNFPGGSAPNYVVETLNDCCTEPLPTTGMGNITNEPAFVDWADGDFHLQSNSPCINAGDNSYVFSSTDLGGNARIVNGVVDAGAYEYQGNIRYVSLTSTNPVPPYSDWSIAATNIQDAVNTAVDGDLVLVTNGVYGTGGRIAYGVISGFGGGGSNRVTIDKAVTVQSVNGPLFSIIQGYQVPVTGIGSSAIRCVWLTNGAVLSGFTLTNGATTSSDVKIDGTGGGAFSAGIITNCIITSNMAAGGAGIYGGKANHCKIIGNTTTSGGAGGGAWFATLDDCLVFSNSAPDGFGGGAGPYSTLNNCTVVFNSAGSGGGTYGGTDTNSIVFFNTGGNYGYSTLYTAAQPLWLVVPETLPTCLFF